MDVAPFINSDSRTMIPVRIISEFFGANISWIQDTQEITISK
jgi:hypothetical protein